MQIIVNRSRFASNFEKAEKLVKSNNSTLSVLVKDFYSKLDIQSFVCCRIWSGKKIKGSYNYILFGTDLNKHIGGLIISKEEVKELSKQCFILKKKFQGFIPLNMGDDREGLSYVNAVELFDFAKDYENDYFTLNSISITNGCLANDLESTERLKSIISKLRSKEIKYISAGGSYYLGFLHYGERFDIDEFRVGEFIIYGTIPFYEGDFTQFAMSAIHINLNVAMIYEDRKHVLIPIGSRKLDVDLSEIKDNNYQFVSKSTEYTILEYKSLPVVGDFIKIIPNYHSLIKLLR